MENQQPKTGKFALNYGLLLGAIGIVYSLMKYFMDLQYQQTAADWIISILLILGILTLSIYQYKKTNHGFLKLSQAIKLGLGVALVGALVSIVYLIIYFNVIDPNFMENSEGVARASIVENNPDFTNEQINNALEMREKFFWIVYPYVIIFNLLVGLVVSLIAGLIMKKSPSDY